MQYFTVLIKANSTFPGICQPCSGPEQDHFMTGQRRDIPNQVASLPQPNQNKRQAPHPRRRLFTSTPALGYNLNTLLNLDPETMQWQD